MARRIKLTKGMFAIVDDGDFEWLDQFNWCANTPSEGRHYAVRSKGGKIIRMHRFILGVTNPKIHVDHINRNTLDNRRSNLRTCTPGQNAINAERGNANTSRFRGVSLERAKEKFRAVVCHEGKYHNVGRFADEIEAAKAYNKKARELHGEFAVLNDV